MKEQDALCLFRGFTSDQISAGLAAAAAAMHENGYADTSLLHTVITDNLLDARVGDYIEGLLRSDFSEPDTNGNPESASARAVLILTSNRQRLFKIMRAIKSVSDNPQDIIFASVTETALTWTFRDYFSHLSAEHEYMKTHSPDDDPDMRAETET